MKNIVDLVNEFESFTLPSEEWTHANHLRVALWYLYHTEDFYQAIAKIKCGWIRYGTIKPASICYERYHETITLFWVAQIKQILLENREQSLEKLEEIVLKDKRINNKNLIYKFYSQKKLRSLEAKSIFVYPSSWRYKLWKYNKPDPIGNIAHILGAITILLIIVSPLLVILRIIEGNILYYSH